MLIDQQRLLLKDGGKASAALEIKTEFAKERKKLQDVINSVDNGLVVLSKIGDIAKKAVNICGIPTTTNANKVVGAFEYAISALKQALEYLRHYALVKIDERERSALEGNANSWNHLVNSTEFMKV